MPWSRLPGALAVLATVVGVLFWLTVAPSASSGTRLAIVAGALAAHALVLVLARRPGALTRSVVVVGIVAVLGAAVLTPPRDSNDLWGYVSYARVLTVHHANPYERPPSDFPDDPLLERMSEEYRSTPSIYGPAFTVVSATGTLVAGPSATANRLFFQGLALTAAVVGLVLVDRRAGGRDPAALAFLGLSPLTVAIVNGAHTDLIIGALLLGAVVVAGRRRPVAVGVLLALAALVKVVALAPAAAVVIWVWRRQGVRAAAIASAVSGALIGGAYLVVGGAAALQPVRDGRLFGSRGQAWEILRTHWSDALAADGVRDAAELAHTDVARISLPLVLLVLLVALWRLSRDADPAVPTTGAGLAYLLTAPYVLPWYSGWILPSAATVWRTPVALLAQAQAALVFLVYADPPGRLPPEGPLLDFSSRWAPVLGIALAVALLVLCFWHRPDPAASTPAPADDTDTRAAVLMPASPSAPLGSDA
jgi:hypothetical protein